MVDDSRAMRSILGGIVSGLGFEVEDAADGGQALDMLRNKADTLVYTTEKALKDFGDKVSESDKKDIQNKLEALRAVLKLSDAKNEQIQKAIDELTSASHKLAEQMYKAQTQQQAQPGAGQTAGAGPESAGPDKPEAEKKPKDEDVVDAEYKDENNK